MALKLFGGRLIIGKQLSQYGGRAEDFYGLMQQRYGIDYNVRNRLDAYKNIVYGCVSLIGEACGDYQPYVEKPVGSDYERADHEFLRLLQNPSGNAENAESFSQFDLFEATIVYQLLQGDCFWYMGLGASGRPREIVMLRADKVGTDVDPKTGKINGYFIRQAMGDPIPLEVNEVLRFNLFNPKDPYKGYSPTQAGSDYIGTDEATASYTKNFFANGAGLGGILEIKGEITKGAFKKFVRAFREKHEGTDNAGKLAIIRESDAKFTPVGSNLSDLQMPDLRKMTLDDVLIMFKVPLPLLGKAEQTGLGRANVEALEYIFAKYNIDKKMKRLDAVLQFALKRYYPEDVGLRICHESVIPEDKEFELQERDKGVDRWITRNEIRKDEEGDDIPGGDTLFVPAMQVPIGDASADTAPPEDDASESGIKITVQRKIVKAKPVKKVNENNERFRSTLMKNQSRYERQYKKVLRPILRDQRAEALVNLEAHASSVKKDNQLKLFDDAAYDQRMVEALTPMLTDLTRTQGGLALIFAGDEENEFYVTNQILSKLQTGTRKMATNFNDETIKKLNNSLAAGIQNGEGIGQLKTRVSSVFDDVDGYRAERIARTETLKASNSATLDAYRQTGYVTGKQWVVNPNACEQCLTFEGQTIDLEETFLSVGESYTVTGEDGEDDKTYTNTYDDVDGPPLHPNCECTIIPFRDTNKQLQLEREARIKAETQARTEKTYSKSLESMLGINDAADES